MNPLCSSVCYNLKHVLEDSIILIQANTSSAMLESFLFRSLLKFKRLLETSNILIQANKSLATSCKDSWQKQPGLLGSIFSKLSKRLLNYSILLNKQSMDLSLHEVQLVVEQA